METWQKDYILKCLPELIPVIECGILFLSIFVSKGILTQGEMHVLLSYSDKLDQSYKLLYKLMSRKIGYEILTNALYQTKQSGALLILLRGFQEENIDKPFEICGISLDMYQFQHTQVMFQGISTTLQKISNNFPDINCGEIFKTNLDADSYSRLISSKLTLVNDMVPLPLKYYIPRSLSIQNRINPSAFSELTEDIFVFQNIEPHQLNQLAWDSNSNEERWEENQPNNSRVTNDVSSNQIRAVTSRFILLQADDHFIKIVNASQKQVHRVQYQDGKYSLITSSNGFRSIQKYVEKERFMLKQAELLEYIVDYDAPRVFCVSDSPGMGKSTLLAEIARNIQTKFKDRLVLFINLPQLVEAYHDKYGSKSGNIKDLLVSFSSANRLDKAIISKLISSSSKTKLFLDGFDEVLPDLLITAKSILQTISKEFVNTWIYVATRPHMRQELEEALSSYAYNIEPFQESDQVQFLVKFWQSRCNPVLKEEHLETLAKSCLSSLDISDHDREITGIPLQCRLLAEIHLNEIKLNINNLCSGTSKNLNFTPTQTVFEMYRRHMENCFNKSEEANRNVIVNYHRYEAMKLLFPEFVLPTAIKSEEPEMFRFGLMETSLNENCHRFVHRTFAYYLVAENLAEIIINNQLPHQELGIVAPNIAQLIFKTALESVKSKMDITRIDYSAFIFKLDIYKFKHPAAAYFFNEHLKFNIKTPKKQDFQQIFTKSEFSMPNILFEKMLCALFADHLTTFQLLKKPFLNCNPIEQIRNAKLDWKVLLQVAAQCSSPNLFRDCCEFVETAQGNAVHELDYEKETTHVSNPVQISIRRGNYQIFEYLIHAYHFKLENLKYHLHVCVDGSYGSKNEVISNKLRIIETLLSLHKEFLNEIYKDGRNISRPPLLMDYIHFKLLECLISKGADIVATDNFKQNVAHIAAEYLNAEEYHKLAEILIARNGSHLFTSKNSILEDTPIHFMARKLEVSSDTLRLLSTEAKVTFNTKNIFGNTEFFEAIEGGRSTKFLECMIELGADWKAENILDKTALHVACEWDNEAATELLLLMGANPNANDKRGSTPLHWLASCDKSNSCIIAKLLLKKGANVNAVDRDGKTPIQLAQKKSKNEIAKVLLESEAK